MPAGNTLGPRRYYLYTSDGGSEYSYLTDETLGTAAGATLNDSNPPLPRRFKPRGVWVEGTAAGQTVRKFVVCPTSDSTLYAAEASQAVSIDGISFRTTGRRGEAVSFGSNPVGTGSGGGGGGG